MKELQYSYGIIPLRQLKGIWQVFLVQHIEGHWSLPKGKQNPGETAFETAQRELFEETGLNVKKLLSSEQFDELYRFRRGQKDIHKTVTYFVAECEGQEKLQEAEIQKGEWFDCSKAYKQVTYPQMEELLKKVVALVLR